MLYYCTLKWTAIHFHRSYLRLLHRQIISYTETLEISFEKGRESTVIVQDSWWSFPPYIFHRWCTRTMISAWSSPASPALSTPRWSSRVTWSSSAKTFPPSTPSTSRPRNPTWPCQNGTPSAWAPSPLTSAPLNPTGWSSSPTVSLRTGGTRRARRTTRWTSLQWSCSMEGCTCC